MADALLSTDEAAALLGVAPRTVVWMVERGELTVRIVGRKHRFRVEDVEAFLERSRVQPGTLGHLRHPTRGEPVVRVPRPPKPRVDLRARALERREAAKLEAEQRAEERAGERAAAVAARRAQVVERYVAGMAAERVARSLGIGIRTAYADLAAAGVERRGLRSKTRVSSFGDMFTEDFLAREYVEKRRSVADIAREVGCSESTVLNWLRRRGIPTRGRA